MAVRAQYARGVVGGEEVPGYLEEEGVPADSTTETYAAVRLEDRQLALGRRAVLPAHRQAARAQDHGDRRHAQAGAAPGLPSSRGRSASQPNQLILAVQPNEGVSLSLVAKIPGARMSVRPVNMEFLYGTSFMSQSPEAYERLILDTMRGDATLFARNDEVEAAGRSATRSSRRGRNDARADPAVPGRLAGPGGGGQAAASGGHALAAALSDHGDRERRGGIWCAAGHDAVGDRGGAAQAARPSATRRTRAYVARARAQPDRRSSTASGRARSRTGSSASGASTRRARSSVAVEHGRTTIDAWASRSASCRRSPAGRDPRRRTSASR